MSRVIKFRVWYRGQMIAKSLNDLLIDASNNYMFVGTEVMQFTGLLDKNGKEVYEGDIVRDERYGSLFEVMWCNGKHEYLTGQVGWILDDHRFSRVGHTVDIGNDELTGYIGSDEFTAYQDIDEMNREEYYQGEVIGNIYEHPDLLNGAHS